jgi:hypothetical protein
MNTIVFDGHELVLVPYHTEYHDVALEIIREVGPGSVCGACPAYRTSRCLDLPCGDRLVLPAKYIPITKLRTPP